MLLLPIGRNFAKGKSSCNFAADSFVKIGVSQRLCRRKEQQNLHEAQSDFFKIDESTTITPQAHKIFPGQL